VRAAVAQAARRLAGAGLVLGTAGNVSAREGDLLHVTPTGARLGALDAAEVATVRLADGAQVAGPLAPTSELALHRAAYAADPGCGAVVHAHAPVATAVGCVVDELPVVHYDLLALGAPVPVVPYVTFGTPELAAAVGEALAGGRRAVLLANHGAVTTGPDLEGALEAMELLEWGATVLWRARALGEPRVLGEQDVAAFRAAVADRGYGAPIPSRVDPP
jgi:L-fuculose-phosphate aldolase